MVALIRLVDDDPNVLSSEAYLLRLKGWQVAAYSNAEDFLLHDDPAVPGCIVLDIRMPGASDMDLQETLRKAGNDLPILFLTGHATVQTAVTALRRGAADFLEKPIDPVSFQERVGELVTWHLEHRAFLRRQEEARARWETLTQREKTVAKLAVGGKPNKVLAEAFGISEQTVKVHRSNLNHKLDIRSSVELLDLLRLIEEMPAASPEPLFPPSPSGAPPRDASDPSTGTP